MVAVGEFVIGVGAPSLWDDSHNLLETRSNANMPAAPCVRADNSDWVLEEVFGVVITGFLVPFILCSNFLVVLAVSKFKRLQIPTNYFLVSLAVADIFIALVIPLMVSVDIAKDSVTNIYLCMSPNRILTMACGVSILTLAAIAYDRYTALVNPLEYISVMTGRRISVLVALSWLYAAAIAWLPLISNWHEVITVTGCSFRLLHSNAHILFLSAVFAPACLAIFFCYFRIYAVARHHARAIAAVETSVRHNAQTRHIMKDTKYAKTLALVMGVFLILWLPYLTCLLAEVIAGVFINDWARNYLSFLAFLNSGVNPWVYAFKNNEFRAAFKKIFKDYCGRWPSLRRPSVASTSSSTRLSRTSSRIASSEILQTVAKLGHVTDVENGDQMSKVNPGFIPDLLHHHLSGSRNKMADNDTFSVTVYAPDDPDYIMSSPDSNDSTDSKTVSTQDTGLDLGVCKKSGMDLDISKDSGVENY